MGMRGASLRGRAIGLAVAVAALAWPGDARSACAPDPSPSGGTVTCSGADANGFNAGSAVNLNLTVQPGATVSNTGSNPALNLTSGNTVSVSGAVSSTNDGARLTTGNTVQIQSGGSVTSNRIGISTSGTTNFITNAGAINTSASGDDGIRATANANTITNAAGATINARIDGIDARSGTAGSLQMLTNAGAITAGQDGIRTQDFNLVTNTGNIAAGLDGIEVRANSQIIVGAGAGIAAARFGISATSTGNTITNSGAITTSGASADDGIRASANSNTITNAAGGTINARLDGIDARSGTAAASQFIANAGAITAGQVGIRAINFNSITNSGGITAGLDGIVAGANNQIVNATGATIGANCIGISTTGTGNVITNAGAITTSSATGDDGIRATGNSNTITNAAGGTINSVIDGIDARSGTAGSLQAITNAGSIAAGQVGVRAIDFNLLTNSGGLTAGSDGIVAGANNQIVNAAGVSLSSGRDGIVAGANNQISNDTGASLSSGRIGISTTGTGNVITNSGTIATSGALGDDGIRATANSNIITNAAGATVNARMDGIDARSGTAGSLQAIVNAGSIAAGQDGLRLLDFNTVNNTGDITAGLDGIEVRANNQIIVGAGAGIAAGRYGISATSTGNTITNSGTITTSGATGDDAIRAAANSATITNAAGGAINAVTDGIDARSGTAGSLQALTNAGSIAAGQDGIRALDFNTVTNTGTIAAGLDGAELRANNQIVNETGATIGGNRDGLRLTGAGNIVTNRGTITGTTGAGLTVTGTNGVNLVNDGTISGATGSVISGTGIDTVVNRGTLNGNIALNSGNDTVANFGAINGDVSLGAGTDRLTLNQSSVLIGNADGGTGTDTMILDGSGNYAGTIQNFETLTKTGLGAWRLTGGPSFATATQIAAGELIVNGSLATQLTAAPGATLSGSGTVNGNVTSIGGTVSPGDTVGTLTVGGNFTSDAASTLRVEIDDAGGGDRLTVGGAAQIDGTLQIDTLPGNYSTGGQVYDLLVAGGGLTGEFDAMTVSQPLRLVLEYLPDRVRLTTLQGDLATVGETENQRSVGRYLDGIAPVPGSDLANVLLEVSRLDSSDLPDALDQLNPEVYDAYTFEVFAGVRRLWTATVDRIRMLAAARNETPTSMPAEIAAQIASIEPAADLSIAGAAPGFGIAPLPGSGWAAVAGGVLNQDESDGHVGYESKSLDVIVGFDGEVYDRVVLGLAGSVSSANIDWTDHGGDGDATTASGGLYGAYLGETFRLEALGGYGHDWYDTDRSIEFGGIDRVAESDSEGDHVFGAVGGGLTLLDRADWLLEATADLSYVKLWADDFEETGAGSANLEVDDRTAESLRSVLGGVLARSYTIAPKRTLTPHVSLGWAHEHMNDGHDLVAGFSGLGTTFTIEGADAPRDSLLVGAGVALLQEDSVALSLRYEGEFAGERIGNILAARLSLRF